jgi:signal transduction histidine kinase
MKHFPWSPRTWRATANAALDLPYGVVVGALLIAGLSVGISLIIVVAGIFIVAATLLFARWCGAAFRAKLSGVLLVDVPGRPKPQPAGGIWAGTWALLRSPAAWKDLLHGVLMLVLGPLWFSLVTATWSAAVATLTFPLYASQIPDGPAVEWDLLGFSYDVRGLSGRILQGILGVALLFVASWVAGLTARADVGLTRALLGPNEAELLRAQVDTLRTTRAAVVDAADAERRRIERDLHDGVQPQLVSLAMNLGLAQRRLDDDPEGAAELMRQAHEESKRAITELRNVIRGVHPAVLTERGLDPALSALAARSPVAVTVTVDSTVSTFRPGATVEAVAYFVVAEALTNVARHSGATQALVDVRFTAPDRMLVSVSDDGAGGAVATPGSGLAGLADRVAAVDGTFAVVSPPGGGTIVTAELPCAS